MSKYVLILWVFPLFIGGIVGYNIPHGTLQEDTTACPSPQSEGDVTIGRLIKHENGLKLVCESHSLLKATNSPNKGERK